VIPTFTVLLALAFVYQLILLYDTLAKENTIQVFSLCLYDMFLCIYSVLQIVEIKASYLYLYAHGDFNFYGGWFETKPVLIAIAITTGLFTFCTCIFGWKVYDEFAWGLFKFVHADSTLRRRYLIFEVRSSMSLTHWHRL
jgi:hypothetical protein